MNKSNYRRKALISAFLLSSLSTLCHADSITNGSFETPNVGAGNYMLQPSGATWGFLGSSGIANAGNAYTSSGPEIPAGQQVAFINGNGYITQTVYLPAATGAVLTFHAMQRVNAPYKQSLQVLVNGVAQPFRLGTLGTGVSGAPPADACALGNATSCTAVTPPSRYYETYAVKLNSGVTPGYNNTIKISGTNPLATATALIDSVSISTPSAKTYGFWDQGMVSGAWRSDHPTNTNVFSTGPCIYTSMAEKIVTAGATPYGTGDCWGLPGSGYTYAGYYRATNTYPISNWSSSSQYMKGNPYWTVSVNNEPVISPVCSSGPPNQSRPLMPAGAAGFSLSINPVTSASDPAIGNYNVASLIYNSDPTTRNQAGCLPYLAFGTSSTHGNAQPIALIDRSTSYYRPRLTFKEGVVSTGAASPTVVRLVISASGWSDNIRRMLQISLGAPDDNPQASAAAKNSIKKEWWNWNMLNSTYYPGAIIAYANVSEINAMCGMSLPKVSFSSTYLQNPYGSISSYDIDLHRLITCVANNGGWAQTGTFSPYINTNGSSQLPDPIIVSLVEWATEHADYANQPVLSNWVGMWNPVIVK